MSVRLCVCAFHLFPCGVALVYAPNDVANGFSAFALGGNHLMPSVRFFGREVLAWNRGGTDVVFRAANEQVKSSVFKEGGHKLLVGSLEVACSRSKAPLWNDRTNDGGFPYNRPLGSLSSVLQHTMLMPA